MSHTALTVCWKVGTKRNNKHLQSIWLQSYAQMVDAALCQSNRKDETRKIAFHKPELRNQTVDGSMRISIICVAKRCDGVKTIFCAWRITNRWYRNRWTKVRGIHGVRFWLSRNLPEHSGRNMDAPAPWNLSEGKNEISHLTWLHGKYFVLLISQDGICNIPILPPDSSQMTASFVLLPDWRRS